MVRRRRRKKKKREKRKGKKISSGKLFFTEIRSDLVSSGSRVSYRSLGYTLISSTNIDKPQCQLARSDVYEACLKGNETDPTFCHFKRAYL